MEVRVLALMAAMAAYLASAGCSGPSRPAWASLDPDRWADRSSRDEPITFEAPGPLAVDVDSFAGDVVIHADPRLTSATVTIVRVGRHGQGRAAEAAASLSQISATAQMAPGELGPVLQIRTATTHAEPHFQRAHVYIETPQVEGITIRTREGRVEARSVQGPIDIETSNGDVRLMSNLPITQSATIINRNGDIDYRVRGESTGRFDAQAVNGRVRSLVRYGNMKIQSGTNDERLLATLNDGTNPIILRTANGQIRVAVVHNPEQVGDTIF